MYLKRLKLKNYRLFLDVDILFQYKMNVLIGKNSSGKSTILEAINFLLSNNDANVTAEEIIPYNKREQNTKVHIEGFFEMSDIEKENICAILDNADDRNLIRDSHLEIIYSKIINKTSKGIKVTPNLQTNGNGISQNTILISHIVNSLLPKLQLNNLLRITDIEDKDNTLSLLPFNQLLQKLPYQTSYLNQYLRSVLYDMKQGDVSEFNNIKNEIIKAYPDISDMDIEFDPKRAQIQVYFKVSGSNIKIPLESEGSGIREFFYLLLTLRNFPDTIILKDEALTHLHKALLSDFVTAIDGLQYQMITTSHIGELIRTLDFSNIIICRKHNNIATVKNLTQLNEIDTLLDELGYPIEAVPEIDMLIKELKS